MERWPPWLTLVLITMLICPTGMAQRAFTIDWVKLTLLPASTVESGTNVTLHCEAKVSHSFSQLIHTFTFLLENTVIYSKNSSEAVVERILAPARASNSGLYKCRIQIHMKDRSSEPQTLTVTGLQTPQLKVQTDMVYEGDEITVTCSAPEETGSLHFYFFKNGEEYGTTFSSSNSVNITMEVRKLGENYLHCNYRLVLHRSGISSNNSKTVTVIVQEHNITPVVRLVPDANVVEGDRVEIICNVSSYNKRDLEIFLIKNNLLYSSHETFTYSFQPKSEDSGEYMCKAEKGNVQKTSTAYLTVEELFSVPVLRMTPEQVFEGQRFSLNCESSVISLKRNADVKYTLYKNNQLLKPGHMTNITASQNMNGNYTCKAQAKFISKTSKRLTVNAKVPISTPVIHTVGQVIVKQPFQILCESKLGTLPITYTLLKFQTPIERKIMTGPLRSVLFNIPNINHKEEIQNFVCQAQNQGAAYSKSSQALNARVIEPVSRPELTLYPKGHTITEGMNVTIYCSVQQGTVPVNFTWYRSGITQPLETKQISKTQGAYTIKGISRDQKGDYYCEASNDANVRKESALVNIGVNLAGWKKAVIAAICILILVLIVTILVLFLKQAQAPRKRKRAIELSVKPARPKSNDPMRMSLTLDIEDNTAINTTPGLMGKNVWSEHVSDSDSDDLSKEGECEELQYTEVYPKQTEDTEKVPMMQDTDTVNGEVRDCTQGTMEESATDARLMPVSCVPPANDGLMAGQVNAGTEAVPDSLHQSPLEYVQLNHCEQDPE